MSENIKPLSLAEGKAYLDGEEVIDLSKMTIRFNPKVASYKVAGKKGTHRRWVGYDVTVTVEEYKTTNRYEQIVKKYIIDVTDENAVNSAVKQIIQKETKIDAVINCAGFGISGAVEFTSTDQAKAQFDLTYSHG